MFSIFPRTKLNFPSTIFGILGGLVFVIALPVAGIGIAHAERVHHGLPHRHHPPHVHKPKLPPQYPPTYRPGRTTYLEACRLVLRQEEKKWRGHRPPKGYLKARPYLAACSTAVKQDEFLRRVSFQIPGRDFRSEPPRTGAMTLYPLASPTPQGNARFEVMFNEPLPNTVNFVWNREIKTLRDDGQGADPTAGDGFYNVILMADLEAAMEQSVMAKTMNNDLTAQAVTFRGGIPLPIFGKHIVSTASPSGEVKPSAISTQQVLQQQPVGCGPIGESSCFVDPEKAMMIRDLSVVNDVDRTSDPCLSSNVGDAAKKWNFGYLISQMLKPGSTATPSDFALNWLNNWKNTSSVNGQTLAAVAGVDGSTGLPITLPELIERNWLEASQNAGAPAGILLMSKAPFRLLAIVNRFDLRKNLFFGGGAAGELRFVFGILDNRYGEGTASGPCKVMDIPDFPTPDPTIDHRPVHTVILEYEVDKLDVTDVLAWAQTWWDLNQLSLGSPQYLSALESITESVVAQGAGAPWLRANDNELGQIRTNETGGSIGPNTGWDLREFVIDEVTGPPTFGSLIPTTVKQAPADILNGTDILGKWMSDNTSDILSGLHTIPNDFPAGYPAHPSTGNTYFRGAQTINETNAGGFWQPNPAGNWLDYSTYDGRRTRHLFSLNACNACHGKETKEPNTVFFAHVKPRKYTQLARLSSFLTGLPTVESDVLIPFPQPSIPTNFVFVPDPVISNKHLNSVVFTGDQHLAVGDGGAIVTSPEGFELTDRNSGVSENLNSVTWTGSQLVAVGDNGTILTSPDGITWTSRSSGTIEGLFSVTWTGGQLVAVGATGTILTSPNGSAWTARTSGSTEGLLAATWTGSRLVTVGNAGVVLTSPDGIIWTVGSSGTTAILHSVTWTGSQLAVVGDNGTILTSPDGVTWTGRASGTTLFLNSVAGSGGQMVAVGQNGTILYSPDGITWSAAESRTTFTLRSATWTGQTGRIVATVGEFGSLLTSPDAISAWSLASTGDRFRFFEDLFFRNEDMANTLFWGLPSSPSTPEASLLLMSAQPSRRAH